MMSIIKSDLFQGKTWHWTDNSMVNFFLWENLHTKTVPDIQTHTSYAHERNAVNVIKRYGSKFHPHFTKFAWSFHPVCRYSTLTYTFLS